MKDKKHSAKPAKKENLTASHAEKHAPKPASKKKSNSDLMLYSVVVLAIALMVSLFSFGIKKTSKPRAISIIL